MHQKIVLCFVVVSIGDFHPNSTATNFWFLSVVCSASSPDRIAEDKNIDDGVIFVRRRSTMLVGRPLPITFLLRDVDQHEIGNPVEPSVSVANLCCLTMEYFRVEW